MDAYSYIKDLFSGILDQSKAIQGRFYMSYKFGAQEINHDELSQVIGEIKEKKYPLSLMPPPTSRGAYTDTKKGEWERFRIIIFFVKETYKDNVNEDTHISQHSVQQDWDDMKRCALAFKAKLELVQKATQFKIFRIPDNIGICTPVSAVGIDRVSGIKYDFDFDIYLGCLPEQDYEDFVVPAIDANAHPEHVL